MTKASIVTAVTALTAFAAATPRDGLNKRGFSKGYSRHDVKSESWGLKKFTSLVAFGDSYTDDSRLGYFGSHNGSAPPVGWVNPAVSRMRYLFSVALLSKSAELPLCRRRSSLAAVCRAVFRR